MVTDEAGNSSACDATVTVVDSTPPTVFCPPDSTLTAGASCEATVPDVTAGVLASDGCSETPQLVVEQVPAAASTVGLGVHVITVTATDAAGNSAECTTTLTVENPGLTDLVCATSRTLLAGGHCHEAKLHDLMVETTVVDLCSAPGSTVLTQTPPPGTLLPLGVHTVTITATHTSGHSLDCDVEVTVECDGARVPGDCNQDNAVDMSDAVGLIGHLFLGTPAGLPCGDMTVGDPADILLVDFNGDVGIDLSDAVALLGFIFQGHEAHVLAVPGEETAVCVSVSGCSSTCP